MPRTIHPGARFCTPSGRVVVFSEKRPRRTDEDRKPFRFDYLEPCGGRDGLSLTWRNLRLLSPVDGGQLREGARRGPRT
jgi:hypothetical protein